MVWTGVILAFLGLDLDVGYYLHLIRGQASLLWNREPIERVLKDQDLSPEARKRLLWVQKVKHFAQDRIGLSSSKTYSTFVDLKGKPVSWNLTACPKDRLEPVRWSYPVVGSAPYRGYFDRSRAEKEQRRLEEDGYDTYLRPVGAYSTLGWFADPILSSMLAYQDGDLAGVVIHEMTHATVWIPGDVTFNESLANFVGDVGALMFLKAEFGPGSERVQKVLDGRKDQQVFRLFMQDVAASLDSLYQTDIPLEEKLAKREGIFHRARTQFEALPLKTDLYASFPRWTLNNARMALYRIYHEDVSIFSEIYDALGQDLVAAIGVFRLCEDVDDAGDYLKVWLNNRQDSP